MNLNRLIDYVKLSSIKADVNIGSALGSFLRDFENQLKGKAPVDSGAFREAWSSTGASSTGNGFSASISNNSAYAGAIEFGSAPGSKPWLSPGPKTAMSGGRIYSRQAIGGTLDKVFDDKNTSAFAEAIASAILRAFR